MPIKKLHGILVFGLRQILLSLAAGKFDAVGVGLFCDFGPGEVFPGAAKIDNFRQGYFDLAQVTGGCLSLPNRKSSNSPVWQAKRF